MNSLTFIPFVLFVLFVVILCYCVWTDLTTHKIKNIAVLLVLVVGLVFQGLNAGLHGVFDGCLGLLIGFVFFLPGYIKRITSAGDVKLVAACGMFLGVSDTLVAIAVTLISGAVFALCVLAYKGALVDSLRRWRFAMLALFYRNADVYIPPAKDDVAAEYFPYALAIACGSLFALVNGPLYTVYGVGFIDVLNRF